MRTSNRRAWTITVGELKGLSRAELLLTVARCCLRVAPWRPPGAEVAWQQALTLLVEGAFTEPKEGTDGRGASRTLSDLGARACTQRDGTRDEAVGRAMNYATVTLCAGLDAAALPMGAALKKAVILCAKSACSIGPVLAHAGRVAAPGGIDPVTFAAEASWAAVRADLAVVRGVEPTLRAAQGRLDRLEALAPLWPGAAPAWAS